MGAACLAPTMSKWLRYMNLPPNLGAGFPGNTFSHGSLLSPAASVNAASAADQCTQATPQFCDGVLGTIRVVTDAVTFLQLNK
ncbi:MAG: hypothetical protein H0T46_31730 [Deltaproteobacteria bacterium]|nr:hypothetical protein [Deltaproteobacteria bacterium]